MRRIMTTVVVAALLASVAPVFGGITGYTAVTVPGNSEAVVSDPYVHGSEGTFTVDTITGDSMTVTEDLTTAFGGAYYVRFLTGSAKGLWCTIQSSDTTAESVTLVNGGMPAEASTGDTFKIVKHTTIADAFPPSLLGIAMKESVVNEVVPGLFIVDPAQVKTKVVAYSDPSGSGQSVPVNEGPTRTFIFWDGAWRNFSAAGVDANDAILPPDYYFVVQNENNNGKLTFVPSGTVDTDPKAVKVTSGAPADIPLAAGPVPVKLSDLDLGGTAAFEDSVVTEVVPGLVYTVDTPGDLLIPLKDDPAGPLPVANYIYATVGGTSGWREYSAAGTVVNDDTINAGTGFLLRKSSLGSGTNIWVWND